MSPTLCNDLSAPKTVSEGSEWVPKEVLYSPNSSSLDDQLAEATPENVELLKWAARPINQPPQKWWDDESNPFEPEND